MSTNLTAFLQMIGESEGTIGVKGSDNGYNVLVGGTLFSSYTDHPRIPVDLGRGLTSTAAGRYQILERYYDAYKAQLHLPDFSPGCQDAIAVQMIGECHAFADVVAGRFDLAVGKCASRWASLPGAGYLQHENKLADLRATFMAAGGVLA